MIIVLRLTDYPGLLNIVEGLISNGLEFKVKTNYQPYPYNKTVDYYEVTIHQETEE